jgi:NACHT domain-containing protein
VPGREQPRLPLPATLSPAQRDFHHELRRLIDVAGLTTRALESVTSSASGPGEPVFYSKSRWGRWLNGQSHPPRKAIKILAEKLADDEIKAVHLLELWDGAFAPEPPAGSAEPAIAAGGERAEVTEGPDSPVAIQLARLVAGECAAELNDRVLQGWQPLAVSWQPAAGPVDPGAARQVPPGDAADVGALARFVSGGGRLIVLGSGGAGKSTLAVLLMDDLLARRQAGDPVPVLIPASTLASGEMVTGWLERTLADRYPPLRDTSAYGPGALGDLVTRRGVLPVIDGLDDLAPEPRGRLLSALSRAFGPRQPLILTCRCHEYREAVEVSGTVFPGGAVIELRAVDAEDVASFLERGTTGPRAQSLRQVVAAVRAEPGGPLARALSSPLMVSLVRASYTGSGAVTAALTRPDLTESAVQSRLLDGLIGASFCARASSEQARPDRPWNARDADRWLTFLARHLARWRSYDLDWLRLRYAVSAFTDPLRRACLGAVLAFVLAGTFSGLGRGLPYGAGQGLLYGLGHGLDAALLVGAVYLLAPLPYPPGAGMARWVRRLRALTGTARRAIIAIPVPYAIESGLRDGIGAARTHRPGTAVLMGLTAALLNWLVAAILVGLATRAQLFDLAERMVYFDLGLPGRGAGFARTVGKGAAWGAGLGVAVGVGIKILGNVLAFEDPLWELGIPAGAVIGAAFALVQWGRTPAASARPASPASTLRADRNLVLLLAVPFLLVIPVFFGAAFARGLDGFVSFGLYGLSIGLTIWLAVVLSHAWPQYLIAAGWLAVRGRLPWRLAAFLSEANDLQVLRQRGGAYQFRHARLQDHLARASANR